MLSCLEKVLMFWHKATAEKRDMIHRLTICYMYTYKWIGSTRSFCSSTTYCLQCTHSRMDFCTANYINGGRRDNKKRLEFFNSILYAFNFEQSIYILVLAMPWIIIIIIVIRWTLLKCIEYTLFEYQWIASGWKFLFYYYYEKAFFIDLFKQLKQ